MKKVLHTKFKIFLASSLSVWPIASLAQTIGGRATPSTFSDTACLFTTLVLDFIPYVVVIAIGGFLTGLIKYVANGDNEEKRGEGTKMMIYGVVGFFFIVSVWGMVKIFTDSFRMPFGVPQLKTAPIAGENSFKESCQFFIGENNRAEDTD